MDIVTAIHSSYIGSRLSGFSSTIIAVVRRLIYEVKFRSLFKEDFQQWFEDLAREIHPTGDFQSIRITQGDGGLDGFVINESIVYQVYAPARIAELRDSETAAKIENDFETAFQTLEGKIKKWVFLHNHPEAKVGKLTSAKLNELKHRHPGVKILVFDIKTLWGELKGLSEEQLEKLFPMKFKRVLRNIPLSINQHFFGRDKILEEIRTKIVENAKPHVITGLGGVGKTRLAIQIAHRLLGDFRGLFIVVGDSPEGLIRSMSKLHSTLTTESAGEGTQSENFTRVMNWFSENRDWLLIIDGVDTVKTASLIDEWLPRLNNGAVILTSRISQFGPQFAKAELEKLSEEDSIEFLKVRTADGRIKSHDEGEQLRRLAQELDGLPLALEQAGAYIDAIRISVREYLEEFDQNKKEVLSWNDDRLTQYPVAVTATWNSSFQLLCDEAQSVIEMLCFFAPEPIPKDLLISSDGKFGVRPAKDVFRLGLADLAKYSLIQISGDGVPTLQLHALVQEVVISLLDKRGEREKRWCGALQLLAYCKISGDGRDPEGLKAWRLLAPHCDSLLGHKPEEIGRDHGGIIIAYAFGLVPLGVRLADYYQLGELMPEKALHVYQVLLEILDKVDPDESGLSCRVQVKGRVGGCLSDLGRIQESIDCYEAALLLAERERECDPLVIARLKNDFALVRFKTAECNLAIPLLEQALEEFRKLESADSHNALQAGGNLALALCREGNLVEARPLMEQVFEEKRTSLGRWHADTLISQANLAELYITLEEWDLAEQLLRDTFEEFRNQFGIMHPRTRIAARTLGEFLQNAGRLESAAEVLLDAIGSWDDVAKEGGMEYLNLMNQLALLRYEEGELDEAVHLLRRSVQEKEIRFGSRVPDTIRGRYNLGQILCQIDGLSEEGVGILREVVVDCKEVFGSTDPFYFIVLDALGESLRIQSEYDESETHLREALSGRTENLGRAHPDTIGSLNRLSILLLNRGQRSEAEALYRESIELGCQVFGDRAGIVEVFRENWSRHQ
ncbi:MAG: tetratricopeptide repeat protein [Verrucomicrobiales bacterium]|nr:tetratricopeptide repeat protein [Verrucomicrobiales bacterium]